MNKEQINKELKEEWREHNGYQVSNFGKVINKKGKVLKTEPSKDGYVHTSIKDYDGKWIRGCRLNNILLGVERAKETYND